MTRPKDWIRNTAKMHKLWVKVSERWGQESWQPRKSWRRVSVLKIAFKIYLYKKKTFYLFYSVSTMKKTFVFFRTWLKLWCFCWSNILWINKQWLPEIYIKINENVKGWKAIKKYLLPDIFLTIKQSIDKPI